MVCCIVGSSREEEPRGTGYPGRDLPYRHGPAGGDDPLPAGDPEDRLGCPPPSPYRG